jgi:hypothetical protein
MAAASVILQVLPLLEKPRTISAVQRALPDVCPRSVDAAVHNATRRGLAVNLRAGEGRKRGGLFVATRRSSGAPCFEALTEVWR